MEAPNNCKECIYYTDCKSYYGGSMCEYEEEINAALKNKA